MKVSAQLCTTFYEQQKDLQGQSMYHNSVIYYSVERKIFKFSTHSR